MELARVGGVGIRLCCSKSRRRTWAVKFYAPTDSRLIGKTCEKSDGKAENSPAEFLNRKTFFFECACWFFHIPVLLNVFREIEDFEWIFVEILW